MIKQAVILAGGLGTRIRHVLSDLPKPMAPIGDKPFLEYIIRNLSLNGFKKFLLLVGYKKEKIIEYFQNGSRFGVEIQYSEENKPLGTGGALLNAFDKLDEEFILINGDTFFDIEFELLCDYISDKKPETLLVLRYTDNILRYGLVEIDLDYKILCFKEKGQLPENYADGYINGGIYYFQKEVLKKFIERSDKKISLEIDILPILVADRFLSGLPMGGKFVDIGIPEDYRLACEEIPKWFDIKRKGATFLDRDGVIINDTGYPCGKDIEFLAIGYKLVENANKEGKYVIVVTNQSGVARGKFSEKDAIRTNELIKKKYSEKGLGIDAFYYCPFHSEGIVEQYKKISLARKPNPGMILKACEDFRISIRHSAMIGDKDSDRIKLFGLKSIILSDNSIKI